MVSAMMTVTEPAGSPTLKPAVALTCSTQASQAPAQQVSDEHHHLSDLTPRTAEGCRSKASPAAGAAAAACGGSNSMGMCAYQLWRVGAGGEGRQDGDHEQRSPDVDGVGAEVLPADVPV